MLYSKLLCADTSLPSVGCAVGERRVQTIVVYRKLLGAVSTVPLVGCAAGCAQCQSRINGGGANSVSAVVSLETNT